MRKLLRFLPALLLLCGTTVFAQVPNNSFEGWGPKTASFGYAPIIPTETHTFQDPDGWSSSNPYTNNSVLGGMSYVTQDTAVKYHLTSSIRMETSSFTVPIVGTTYTVPGLAVSGNFTVDPATLLTGIDPFSVYGSGSPITGKPSKLVGYCKYAPSASDTGEIIAALMDSARNTVATAIYQVHTTTSGFIYFEANFTYYLCNNPDTLVIIMGSSPFSNGVGAGTLGSVLWVDSMGLSYTPAPNVAPSSKSDSSITTKNTPVTMDVVANDFDCEAAALTVTSASTPAHGTTSIVANKVVYTPATGYVGNDAYTYTVCDPGALCATGNAYVTINPGVGIGGVNELAMTIFPNPATTILHIQSNMEGQYSISCTDVSGKVVKLETFNTSTVDLSVADLTNGMYIIRLISQDGTVHAINRVNVIR
jgi:Bacterial Ig domain/Secretion system C-terminal sorting domain/Putative carbohydrate metabolism domain